MGRPHGPKSKRMSDVLRIPLTERDKRRIRRAAKSAGWPQFTVWARNVLLDAAQECLTPKE